MPKDKNEVTVKKKMGRPRKEKKGINVYVPEYAVNAVLALIEIMRRQDQQEKEKNTQSI